MERDRIYNREFIKIINKRSVDIELSVAANAIYK